MYSRNFTVTVTANEELPIDKTSESMRISMEIYKQIVSSLLNNNTFPSNLMIPMTRTSDIPKKYDPISRFFVEYMGITLYFSLFFVFAWNFVPKKVSKQMLLMSQFLMVMGVFFIMISFSIYNFTNDTVIFMGIRLICQNIAFHFFTGFIPVKCRSKLSLPLYRRPTKEDHLWMFLITFIFSLLIVLFSLNSFKTTNMFLFCVNIIWFISVFSFMGYLGLLYVRLWLLTDASKHLLIISNKMAIGDYFVDDENQIESYWILNSNDKRENRNVFF